MRVKLAFVFALSALTCPVVGASDSQNFPELDRIFAQQFKAADSRNPEQVAIGGSNTANTNLPNSAHTLNQPDSTGDLNKGTEKNVKKRRRDEKKASNSRKKPKAQPFQSTFRFLTLKDETETIIEKHSANKNGSQKAREETKMKSGRKLKAKTSSSKEVAQMRPVNTADMTADQPQAEFISASQNERVWPLAATGTSSALTMVARSQKAISKSTEAKKPVSLKSKAQKPPTATKGSEIHVIDLTKKTDDAMAASTLPKGTQKSDVQLEIGEKGNDNYHFSEDDSDSDSNSIEYWAAPDEYYSSLIPNPNFSIPLAASRPATVPITSAESSFVLESHGKVTTASLGYSRVSSYHPVYDSNFAAANNSGYKPPQRESFDSGIDYVNVLGGRTYRSDNNAGYFHLHY